VRCIGFNVESFLDGSLPLLRWGEGWRMAVDAAGNARIVLMHAVLPCMMVTQAAGGVQQSCIVEDVTTFPRREVVKWKEQ
jgi:hypothetical protein